MEFTPVSRSLIIGETKVQVVLMALISGCQILPRVSFETRKQSNFLAPVILFTIIFFNLHYNVIQRECVAISG